MLLAVKQNLPFDVIKASRAALSVLIKSIAASLVCFFVLFCFNSHSQGEVF